MVAHRLRRRAGVARRRASCLRPDPAGPGGDGPALRPGDLRGPQGLPQADGSIAGFPARGERGRGSHRSATGWRCRSCRRSCSWQSLRELLAVDREWVPAAGGEESLYIRPFMFATEVGLGVRPANAYTYLLIASPAGAYFPGGVQAGERVAVHRVRAGRARAVPAPRSSRATTPPRSSRRRRPPSRAVTRWSGSTPSNAAASRRWAA